VLTGGGGVFVRPRGFASSVDRGELIEVDRRAAQVRVLIGRSTSLRDGDLSLTARLGSPVDAVTRRARSSLPADRDRRIAVGVQLDLSRCSRSPLRPLGLGSSARCQDQGDQE